MTATTSEAKKATISSTPLIVTLLRQQGTLTSQDLERVQALQAKDNTPAEHAIVELGIATELEIAKLYSDHLLLPLLELSDGQAKEFDTALGDLIPEKLCRDLLLVPINLGIGTLDLKQA